MGYDKPNLGFVIHYQAPGSIIAYYQQVGRAGRAIPHAVGLLMSGHEDDAIHDYFRRSTFPSASWVEAILEALEDSDGMSLRQLQERINLRHGQLQHTLKFLSVDNPAPVIRDGSLWRRTPVPYRLDHERIRHLTQQRQSEWQEMQRYLDTEGCLMAFLATALDDPSSQACGQCAGCLDRPVVEPSFDRPQVIAATRFLRQSEMPLVCPVRVPGNAFPTYGFSGICPRNCAPKRAVSCPAGVMPAGDKPRRTANTKGALWTSWSSRSPRWWRSAGSRIHGQSG